MKPTTLERLAAENVFEAIGKEWMLVTAGTATSPNTMTASWGGLGWIWNKPVAFVFVRPERFTHHLIEENEGLKKEVEGYVKEHMLQLRDRLVAQAEETNGVHLIKAVIPTALAPAVAKDLASQIAGILPNKTLCVLGTTHETKPLLTVMLSKDLVQEQQLNAGALVREAAKLIKGGGGGAPHFATAGGKDANGLEAAVHKVIELAGL